MCTYSAGRPAHAAWHRARNSPSHILWPPRGGACRWYWRGRRWDLSGKPILLTCCAMFYILLCRIVKFWEFKTEKGRFVDFQSSNLFSFCFLFCHCLWFSQSAMAAFSGITLTILVQIRPNPLPSHSVPYRSSQSTALPPSCQLRFAGEPAVATRKERWRLTPHPSTLIIIIPLISMITLTVTPPLLSLQYPPTPTSIMPTCPRFSRWPLGGSRSVY